MLTLVQTGHSESEVMPILLYGKAFWAPLVSFIEDHLVREYRTIYPEGRRLFTVVDSVDEAQYRIEQLYMNHGRICRIDRGRKSELLPDYF